MKRLFKEYHSFLKERFSGDIAAFVVELIFVLFCVGSGIYFGIRGSTQNALMAFVFPLIVLLVCLIEWRCKLRCGAVFFVLFFLMSSSNILGDGYGLYQSLSPYFDKIMHTLSGVVCTCFGYSIVKKIVGDDGKKFVICLVSGLLFAMAIASLWEVYEYFVSEVLHNDMQPSYIVDTIDYVKYISNTYIYYTDGTYEVVEGYIDIGLFDTLQDITVCLAGSLVTIALLVLDNYCFKRKLNRLIIPKVLITDGDNQAEECEEQIAVNQKTA